MNIEHINKIIKKNKSLLYQCSEERFSVKGTTFRVDEYCESHNGLELEYLYDHHLIAAGKETIGLLKKESDYGKKELHLERIKEIFPEFKLEYSLVNLILPIDKAPELPLYEGYSIKSADPSKHQPLQEFLDSCEEEDIDDALIDLNDPDHEILLVYKGQTPVGYAGYRLWEGGIGDVGILIHHDHRNKGLGSATVARITNSCLKRGFLPLYRASKANTGSVALAEKVGYRLLWESREGVLN